VPETAIGATRGRHWLEHLLWSVADWEAAARTAREAVAQFGAILLEVSPCGELDGWRIASGKVALLISRPLGPMEAILSLPLAPAALLSIQLLTPREHACAVAAGKGGGKAIAARLARAGVGHVASRFRCSVV